MALVGEGGGTTYPRYFVQDNGDGTFSLVEEYAQGGFTVRGTGSQNEMERLLNEKTSGGYTPPGYPSAIPDSEIVQWAQNVGVDPQVGRNFVRQYGRLPNSIPELEQFMGTAGGGGTGATAFLDSRPDIRNAYAGQGRTDTQILTDWLSYAKNDPDYAKGQAAMTGGGGGGYQLPTGYTGIMPGFGGANLPAGGTLPTTVTEPEYWEEAGMAPFLTYLMGQQGISPASPLGGFMGSKASQAEAAQQLARTLSIARGGLPGPETSVSQFLPAYLSGARPGMEDIRYLAGQAGEPVTGAELAGTPAATQMQWLASAAMPWVSSSYLNYLRERIAPAAQTSWAAQGPTTTANQAFLQYLLGRFGGA